MSMTMPCSPTKEHPLKSLRHRPAITSDTIKQREELQKSVLKHTNRLINQLLKNLDEADNVIKKRLSPSHLERLISYLRDDIQPLRGFINKISLHAENLGSMKKEYELQEGGSNGALQNLSFSTTRSESSSSFTQYMLDRTAREPSPPAHKLEPPSPPYHTPRPSRMKAPAVGHASKSCSPMRLAAGDVKLFRKDSSEQVNLDCEDRGNAGRVDRGNAGHVDRGNMDLSQIVEMSRLAISRESRKIYKMILCCMLYLKYKLTGSQRIGIVDCVMVCILMFLFHRVGFQLLDYGWRVYRTSKDMRRGVKPM